MNQTMELKRSADVAILDAPSLTLDVFCHVERLGPAYDSAAKYAYFTLNLTAALTDGAPGMTRDDVIRLLRPWAWQWSDLSVRGIKKDTGTGTNISVGIAGVEVLRDGVPAPGDVVKAFVSELINTLGPDDHPRLENFQWSENGFFNDSNFSDSGQRDWRGFLAHASTFPAPLPHALKMTVFFRILLTDLNDVSEIVAAPVFTSDPPADAVPTTPTASQLDVDDVTNPLHRLPFVKPSPPYFYSWEYTSKGTRIVAYQKQCDVAPPASGDFLDLSTLWLAAPSSTEEFFEEWTQQFEVRLSDGFDMPLRLLDSLRWNLDKFNTAAFWPVQNDFHNAFVASLRDLANYGLRVPPHGVRFADQMCQAIQAPSSLLPLLETCDDTRTKDGNWKNLLAGFVALHHPNFGELPQEAPKPGDTTGNDEYLLRLRNYLRILEHIHTLLAEGATLADFFVFGWGDAILSSGDDKLKAFWNGGGKTRLIAALNDLQLRKRMALGNIGIAWGALQLDNHQASPQSNRRSGDESSERLLCGALWAGNRGLLRLSAGGGQDRRSRWTKDLI